MQAIVLAGGLGTRLREQTEFRPKPMVEIGDRPILWHLLRYFAHYGVTDFVIPVGYRGDVIRDYFLHLYPRSADFTIELGSEQGPLVHGDAQERGWRVTVAETGLLTMTGGRLKRIERFVIGDRVFVAYGDGLANVDLSALLAFHEAHGRLATMVTVRLPSRFGVAELADDGLVHRFREKPLLEGWVNIGFFVFERGVFDRLDDECVLEGAPLAGLADDRELMAFRHEGFWHPVDTALEHAELNRLWDEGQAPWKTWP